MALKDWKIYSKSKNEIEWINTGDSGWYHGKTISVHKRTMKKDGIEGWLSTSSMMEFQAKVLPSKSQALAYAKNYMMTH